MPHIIHRKVARQAVITVKKEGSGFLVRKVIGGVVYSCDPFILLDHIGPVTYKPGEAIGAPDHPHRGFETVTYVIEGGVKHEDSAGHKGELRSGWLQWMTAGRGVLHSEMPTDDLLKNGGTWEGFQLWVNLPAKDKMIEPQYQDVPPEMIPVVWDKENKAKVKVLAGECRGVKAPTKTRTPILFLDIHLEAGGSFSQDIPSSFSAFAYLWRGEALLGHDSLLALTGMVNVLDSEGSHFVTRAAGNNACDILLVAGEPLMEPVVRYGPFVMNTADEIERAIEDYREGKLGTLTTVSPTSGAIAQYSPSTPSDEGIEATTVDSCIIHSRCEDEEH